ncbi:MAG: hypothetical protein ACRCXT_14250 [Paraclostridium sp.]
MMVMCIDNGCLENRLTIGNTYSVVECSDNAFKIKCDDGSVDFLGKFRFKVI